jgi:hypothetical protein
MLSDMSLPWKIDSFPTNLVMNQLPTRVNQAVAWCGTILEAPYFTITSSVFFTLHGNTFFLLVSSYFDR